MGGLVVEGDGPDALAGQLQVLFSVGRLVRAAVRRRFPLATLPDAQVAVLRSVEADAGVSSGTVAERLQLAPSTVSTLVRELVDGGLVLRQTDERNRRASRLWLTEEARERLRVWADVREEVLVGVLARLDPQDRRVLQDALPAVGRLAEALREVATPHSASPSGTTTGQPTTGSRTTAASTP